MKQTRRFRVEMHKDFGNLGVVPLWMPGHQSDPLTGMGAAHDLLEHGPNDVCEWQGLGGSAYVRGQGYFGRNGRGNPDPVENIASDFVNLFHLWEGQDIPDPGRTYATDEDDTLQEVVTRGCMLVRDEMQDHGSETLTLVRSWTRKEQQRRMLGWMRKGYRAAQGRYKHLSRWTVMETFCTLENAIDELLEGGEAYEGGEIVVRFDVSTATVHAAYDYGEDY